MKKILVTGGAGYIGSHTVVELISAGFTPVIVDNFSNSEPWILERIVEISGVSPSFYEGDCTDAVFMDSVFKTEGDIDAVIHFAAYKAVGDSVLNPLRYYKNNLNATIVLLESMATAAVKKLVFSSSATAYGEPSETQFSESEELKKVASPYAGTKVMCEDIIESVTKTGVLHAVSLRYFNPIGAHPSGLLGELPKGVPNNLVPYITQSIAGIRGPITIFGNDYPTSDGTCVRDYIHVVDLALAHVASLQYLNKKTSKPYDFFNVGAGSGVSVLELLQTFEKVINGKIEYVIGERRDGDLAAYYADVKKIFEHMRWQTTYTLEDALTHSWNWQKNLKM